MAIAGVAHSEERKVRVGLNHRHAAPAGTRDGFGANMLPVACERAPLGQGQVSLLLGLLGGRLLGLLGGRLLGRGLRRDGLGRCGLLGRGLLGRRLLDGRGLLLGRSLLGGRLLGGHASETHLRTGRALWGKVSHGAHRARPRATGGILRWACASADHTAVRSCKP